MGIIRYNLCCAFLLPGGRICSGLLETGVSGPQPLWLEMRE